MSDDTIWKLLKDRKHLSGQLISDITDGKQYRKLSEPGQFLCPVSHPANISLMLNTDGVALFKSSAADIWPIFLVINELPPTVRYALVNLIYFNTLSHLYHRFSRNSVLLCGVWYGSSKPNMCTLLRPLVDVINRLYSEG